MTTLAPRSAYRASSSLVSSLLQPLTNFLLSSKQNLGGLQIIEEQEIHKKKTLGAAEVQVQRWAGVAGSWQGHGRKQQGHGFLSALSREKIRTCSKCNSTSLSRKIPERFFLPNLRPKFKVKHQINSHRKIPANLRKKLDKKQMESLSEEAAFVVAVKAEVLQAMPMDPNALHTGWVELYENGDPGVVLEVQSAIMNRSCPNVSEIATLASIMNKHTGSTPLPSKAVMEMEKLEAETFALKMKQLDYDVQALRVSRAKRTSWQLQVHHAKLQYRVQTFNESIKGSRVITFANTDELIRSITAFMGEKTAQLKLDESGNASRFEN